MSAEVRALLDRLLDTTTALVAAAEQTVSDPDASPFQRNFARGILSRASETLASLRRARDAEAR